MLDPSTNVGAWMALAGLGAVHGLNPGMGWLYAVALALHRNDRRLVWLAPLPIAGGHAVSVALAAAAFYWAGTAISLDALRIVAGFALIAASLYVWLYGHRHRVRFGMTIGLAGLTVWSFLMATAHGAGLMLWPALLPLCSKPLAASWSTPLASVLLAVTVHTIAMLVVTTAVAQLVYAWAGLALLRHTWINVDIAWVFAIGLAGIYLLTAG